MASHVGLENLTHTCIIVTLQDQAWGVGSVEVVCIIHQDIDLIKQVQPYCATEVDQDRRMLKKGDCGPGCPIAGNAWKTDDTLRVTHSLDQQTTMIALKMYGIMASSLLLIGLKVTVLGIKVRREGTLGILGFEEEEEKG